MRRRFQNKKKNVHVRSFQELDLDPGVAGGAGLHKLPGCGHCIFQLPKLEGATRMRMVLTKTAEF
jgi:hypothetical protein